MSLSAEAFYDISMSHELPTIAPAPSDTLFLAEITDPAYLWAIMENLHKFNVIGELIMGMFPQRGFRDLRSLPVKCSPN